MQNFLFSITQTPKTIIRGIHSFQRLFRELPFLGLCAAYMSFLMISSLFAIAGDEYPKSTLFILILIITPIFYLIGRADLKYENHKKYYQDLLGYQKKLKGAKFPEKIFIYKTYVKLYMQVQKGNKQFKERIRQEFQHDHKQWENNHHIQQSAYKNTFSEVQTFIEKLDIGKIENHDYIRTFADICNLSSREYTNALIDISTRKIDHLSDGNIAVIGSNVQTMLGLFLPSFLIPTLLSIPIIAIIANKIDLTLEIFIPYLGCILLLIIYHFTGKYKLIFESIITPLLHSLRNTITSLATYKTSLSLIMKSDTRTETINPLMIEYITKTLSSFSETQKQYGELIDQLEKYAKRKYGLILRFRPFSELLSTLDVERNIKKMEQKEIQSMIASWLHEHAKSLKEYQESIRHSVEETNQYIGVLQLVESTFDVHIEQVEKRIRA